MRKSNTFGMMVLSAELTSLGMEHNLVLASKPDALSELLALNKDDAEGECGDADSEFGYFLLFVFKKGQLEKFLEKNKKALKSRNIHAEKLDEALNRASKEASLDDITIIVKIDSDDDVIGVDYYSRIHGLAAWQRIEEAWEDIESEEDDSYDPETDEIEDD